MWNTLKIRPIKENFICGDNLWEGTSEFPLGNKIDEVLISNISK